MTRRRSKGGIAKHHPIHWPCETKPRIPANPTRRPPPTTEAPAPLDRPKSGFDATPHLPPPQPHAKNGCLGWDSPAGWPPANRATRRVR